MPTFDYRVIPTSDDAVKTGSIESLELDELRAYLNDRIR